MVKIAVCIETVFTDLPYTQRIREVAQIGFPAVEFWFFKRRMDNADFAEGVKDFENVAAVCKSLGIEVADFVVNSPDGRIGGSLVKPADRIGYLDRLRKLIPLAHRLGCKRLITCTGNELAGVSREAQHKNIVDTLGEATKIVEKEDITLVLEPLNTFVNHPGYYLDSSKEGFEIIKAINHKNIRLLYDIYHMQIMEGNIISTIEENIDLIGHFHAAGVPGRHELWIGELNYPNVIKEIDELDYTGYFGLEYTPTMDSEKSLRKTKELIE